MRNEFSRPLMIARIVLVSQVRCMKLVQHPNVVRLYEVIDTQTKLYLILELGDGGDLYDYIMRHDSGLSEEVLLHGYCLVLLCHRLAITMQTKDTSFILL